MSEEARTITREELALLEEQVSFWKREAEATSNRWMLTLKEVNGRLAETDAKYRALKELVQAMAKKPEGLTYG